MMSEIVNKYEQELAGAAEFIVHGDDFWIFPHEDPDGDAYGSTLGLLQALRSMGKGARAFIAAPVPRMYARMPGIDDLEIVNALPENLPDVIVVVDNAEFERMGDDFGKELKARGVTADKPGNRPVIINIDHHVSNTRFGDINVVNPDCAAAGVIIFDLLMHLGFAISLDIAIALYVALVTDTGRFSFNNTNQRALEVAGELVALGVDPAKVIEDVYYTRTSAQMKLFGKVFQTITEVPEIGTVYAWQTRKMLEETGTTPSDTEGIVDLIRTIGDYPLSLFFKENERGIKVSMRSRSNFNAADFALIFGGGGHPGASGFKVNGEIEEAIESVLAELHKAF